MKAFFTIIFGALAIVLLSITLYAGFKTLFHRALERIRALFGLSKKNPPRAPDDPVMHTVNLTTGQCQSCGRTWVGTTQDTQTPLTEVEFMGEKRILCTDCLEKLKAEFNRSAKSSEKQYTQSARNLGEMLEDMRRHF